MYYLKMPTSAYLIKSQLPGDRRHQFSRARWRHGCSRVHQITVPPLLGPEQGQRCLGAEVQGIGVVGADTPRAVDGAVQRRLSAVGFGVVEETPADPAHGAQAREPEKLLDVGHVGDQESLTLSGRACALVAGQLNEHADGDFSGFGLICVVSFFSII